MNANFFIAISLMVLVLASTLTSVSAGTDIASRKAQRLLEQVQRETERTNTLEARYSQIISLNGPAIGNHLISELTVDAIVKLKKPGSASITVVRPFPRVILCHGREVITYASQAHQYTKVTPELHGKTLADEIRSQLGYGCDNPASFFFEATLLQNTLKHSLSSRYLGMTVAASQHFRVMEITRRQVLPPSLRGLGATSNLSLPQTMTLYIGDDFLIHRVVQEIRFPSAPHCIKTLRIKAILTHVNTTSHLSAATFAFTPPTNMFWLPLKSEKQQIKTTVSYSENGASDTSERPFIPVKLPGGHFGKMLLDTGSYTCLISKSLALLLSLPHRPLPEDAGWLSVLDPKAFEGTLPFLQVGAVIIPDVECLVMDDDLLASVSVGAGHHIDGVIGGNYLREVATELDVQHHQVTFWYPGGLSPQELSQAGFGGAVVVPTAWAQNSVPYVSAKYGDFAERISSLDTGGTKSFLPNALVSQLNLPITITGIALPTLHGSASYSELSVTSLKVGGKVLSDVPMYFTENTKIDSSWGAPSLGMDVLSHYRLLFDPLVSKVYLL